MMMRSPGKITFSQLSLAGQLHRHHRAGAAVHQRLAGVAVVKHDGCRLPWAPPTCCRRPQSPSARPRKCGAGAAAPSAAARRSRGLPKHSTLVLNSKPCPPDAGSQRVAVVAQDACNGPAIGVDGRGRVVRLHLPHEQRVGVYPHRPRVVAENTFTSQSLPLARNCLSTSLPSPP